MLENWKKNQKWSTHRQLDINGLKQCSSSPLIHLQGMEGNKDRKQALVGMWDERFIFWKTRKTRKNKLFENNDNNGKQQYFLEDKKDKKNN